MRIHSEETWEKELNFMFTEKLNPRFRFGKLMTVAIHTERYPEGAKIVIKKRLSTITSMDFVKPGFKVLNAWSEGETNVKFHIYFDGLRLKAL